MPYETTPARRPRKNSRSPRNRSPRPLRPSSPSPAPARHVRTRPQRPRLVCLGEDNHYADQLIALGKAAAFPARIIDWSREQVEEAIEALAILITQPSPARNTAATPATSSAPKPTRGRRGQRNLYPSDR